VVGLVAAQFIEVDRNRIAGIRAVSYFARATPAGEGTPIPSIRHGPQ
jgi:hypothetical protein